MNKYCKYSKSSLFIYIREYNVDIYNSVKVRQMITEKLDVPQKIQFIRRKSKISILKYNP